MGSSQTVYNVSRVGAQMFTFNSQGRTLSVFACLFRI